MAKNTDPQISANAETAPQSETLPQMTQDTLLTIIANMQRQMLEMSSGQKALAEAIVQSGKIQSEAIIEAGKPKLPPKTDRQKAEEENDKQFREREKQLEVNKKLNLMYEQDNCDHIAGSSSLSEQRDIAGRTSIAWHRNDVGADVGVCTVCQRIFHPTDPVDKQGRTYAYWRKQPSFNRLSQAGHRTMMDPSKAVEDSYLRDR